LAATLTSLLDNAIVHGAGTVRLAAATSNGVVTVCVSDAGEDVPERLRESVFDRQTTGGRGTGIGLALARSLATAESGSLTLSWQHPAEFILTLPTAPPAGTG